MGRPWVSLCGLGAVRRRGYRRDQVDVFTEALSRDRDAAWERAARLTVLARDMEAELERLRAAVEGLAPQSYEVLGERARCIFQLAQEEARELWDSAREEAVRRVEETKVCAEGVREAARPPVDAVRARAEEDARQRLLTARAEADEVRVAARREVKRGRGEVLAALREMRRRTEETLAGQQKEHAERWAAAEREAAGRAEALDTLHAASLTRAETALAEAQREFGAAQESAARVQEDARGRAEAVLAEAKARQDRVARETERVLREHADRSDDVHAQLAQVSSSLSALTGRTPAE
ncbi:cellulose-binding protein [Streptomyces sp. YIM S03343]